MKLFTISDEYILVCSSVTDADKLFTDEGSLLFGSINATPVMPREINANRTVLMFDLETEAFYY